jgi:DNA-binding MarR family transcriptional regulator
MRSIGSTEKAAAAAPAQSESLDRIVAGIHDMIAGFRCAGTGRLVKAGVSMTHMHVMWLLQHHGDLSMSRLAELLDVSFSNATGIIDRMEERGLVERVRVPDDRRVVLVRIAPNGVAALEETEAIKQDRLQAILAHLSKAGRSVAVALDDIRGPSSPRVRSDFNADHIRRTWDESLMGSPPELRRLVTLEDDPTLGLPIRQKLEILGLFLGARPDDRRSRPRRHRALATTSTSGPSRPTS